MTYAIVLEGNRYDGFKDGTPFTLADCWRECYGVRNMHILATTADGGERFVVWNAGSLTTRENVRKAGKAVRRAAGYARYIRAACERGEALGGLPDAYDDVSQTAHDALVRIGREGYTIHEGFVAQLGERCLGVTL